MASGTQGAAIMGGVIIALAAAAGGAYMLLRPPIPVVATPAPAPSSAPPAAAPPAAAPSAVPPAAPIPAPTPTAGAPSTAGNDAPAPPASDGQDTVFAQSGASFTIVMPTAAYVAPSADAPQMYALQPGLGVRAAEQSKDGKWIIALTEDGQAAYLPTASLGPYNPAAEQSVPTENDGISGAATVVDTATLTVNGQTLKLAGISGETGVLADDLQDLIGSQGGNVSCQQGTQDTTTYVCTLPNGTDVARAALWNGAAEPAANAPAPYVADAAAAKLAHRGLWK